MGIHRIQAGRVEGGGRKPHTVGEATSKLVAAAAAAAAAALLQSCLTLCDPMDCSLPGSFVRGIFQARVLEWGAIAFSMRALFNSIALID